MRGEVFVSEETIRKTVKAGRDLRSRASSGADEAVMLAEYGYDTRISRLLARELSRPISLADGKGGWWK